MGEVVGCWCAMFRLSSLHRGPARYTSFSLQELTEHRTVLSIRPFAPSR